MRKEAILWSCAALLVFGSLSWAGQPQPYLGVGLDSEPLPELLTKHLRLDPGQGVRVNNIMVGSPADRAGLERDDLIIAFQEHKITEREQLVEAVRQGTIDAEVKLEVIHLGAHKTVSLKLGTAPDPETVQWKHPPEPDVITSWRPGKIFKIGPDGRDMIEIPLDKIPGSNFDMKKFFQQSYTYHHAADGEDYTITVEGDPADKDSRVIVHAGDQEYRTSAGALEALPEKYRGPAQEALENARTSVKTDIRIHGFGVPEVFGPEARRQFFQNIPRPDLERLSQEKERAVEKLQEQMERLQQQMREMQEHQRQVLDQLLRRNDSSHGNPEPDKGPGTATTEKPAL